MERKPTPSALERMRREHFALLEAVDSFESVACPRPARNSFFPAATVRGLLDRLAAEFAAHREAEDALITPLIATPGSGLEHAELATMMAAFRETLEKPANRDRDEQLRVQASDLVALLRFRIRKEETLVFAIAARRSARTPSQPSPPSPKRGNRP